MTDATHDPKRRSFVASANGHPDFPIQNLPFGLFSTEEDEPERLGIAIGDSILDLEGVLEAGLFSEEVGDAIDDGSFIEGWNHVLSLGPALRMALRREVSDLLAEGSAHRAALQDLLHAAKDCTLHVPMQIGDYTDFYAGIRHATNVGALFRPDNPLLPNYKHVPIGYHGRASSVVPSGTPLRRPNGQRKPASESEPSFGPSRNLDYELELGIWIGGGNALGAPIRIGNAADHIAGYCLLNDWSARDIQGWEYQPLGPFLAKNFGTTVSPWIVTPEALAPFRIPQPKRPEGDPKPMPYLWDEADQAGGALGLELEVFLLTPGLREKKLAPHRLSQGEASGLYWTPAQLVAHHTCGGCNLRSGDLLGTGTISTAEGFGSLLEITRGGKQPLTLASGETRRFLEDGDEVLLTARARREGFVGIGFGECRGVILPAVSS
ncbi:fumarylacetoacetase [Roseomonas sp. AR75]|uniref:fumarylacetoacetase n=1 Tax=Roseomonas sp. AR75 TaxID=2562311 RepID=UPI0010BFE256|nr:fumarylacetoacetase [Roseomonas sp. AR75]